MEDSKIKPIFATDLDRTLIFSKRRLERSQVNFEEFTLVDYKTKTEENQSYIHNNTLSHLKADLVYTMVANTTRGGEEFFRIDSQLRDCFKYAIVSNGAEIYKNNNGEWELLHSIKSSVDLESTASCIDNAQIVEKYYIKIEGKFLSDKLEDYQLSYQGNTTYLIPNDLSKGTALSWLANSLGTTVLYAAGDSNLDLPMLKIAEKPLVPVDSHKELIKMFGGQYKFDVFSCLV